MNKRPKDHRRRPRQPPPQRRPHHPTQRLAAKGQRRGGVPFPVRQHAVRPLPSNASLESGGLGPVLRPPDRKSSTRAMHGAGAPTLANQSLIRRSGACTPRSLMCDVLQCHPAAERMVKVGTSRKATGKNAGPPSLASFLLDQLIINEKTPLICDKFNLT